jgi:hypothetical protein
MSSPSQKTVVIILSIILLVIVLPLVYTVVARTLEENLDLEAKKAFAQFKDVMRKAKTQTIGAGDNMQISTPGYYITFFQYTEELATEIQASEYIKNLDGLTGCNFEQECMCLIFIREELNYINTNKYAAYAPHDLASPTLQSEIINTESFAILKENIWPDMTNYFIEEFIKPLSKTRTMKIVECESLREFGQCNKCEYLVTTKCEEVSGCKLEKIKEEYTCVVDESSPDASSVKMAYPILVEEEEFGTVKYHSIMSLASPLRFEYLLLTKEEALSCNFLWDTSDNELLIGLGKETKIQQDTYNKLGAHQACLRQFDYPNKVEIIDEMEDLFKVEYKQHTSGLGSEWKWDFSPQPDEMKSHLPIFQKHNINLCLSEGDPCGEWLIDAPAIRGTSSYYIYDDVAKKFELEIGPMILGNDQIIIRAPTGGTADEIPFSSFKLIRTNYKTPSGMVVERNPETKATVYWSEVTEEEDNDARPCKCVDHICTEYFDSKELYD